MAGAAGVYVRPPFDGVGPVTVQLQGELQTRWGAARARVGAREVALRAERAMGPNSPNPDEPLAASYGVSTEVELFGSPVEGLRVGAALDGQDWSPRRFDAWQERSLVALSPQSTTRLGPEVGYAWRTTRFGAAAYATCRVCAWGTGNDAVPGAPCHFVGQVLQTWTEGLVVAGPIRLSADVGLVLFGPPPSLRERAAQDPSISVSPDLEPRLAASVSCGF